MSEETAKELTKAIYLLIGKLEDKEWIKGEDVLKKLGIPHTKGTVRKHMKMLRETGKIKEYKKVGREYMYSKSEINVR